MVEGRWSHAAPLRRVLDLIDAREEAWARIFPTAIGVGLLAGGAALGLHAGTHLLQDLLAPLMDGPAVLALPALGALAGSWVVVRLLREPPGHGVPEVVRAVCREGGRMHPRSIVSRWLGSLLAVGSGGSAGLEGPIVHSGAAMAVYGGSLGGGGVCGSCDRIG